MKNIKINEHIFPFLEFIFINQVKRKKTRGVAVHVIITHNNNDCTLALTHWFSVCVWDLLKNEKQKGCEKNATSDTISKIIIFPLFH